MGWRIGCSGTTATARSPTCRRQAGIANPAGKGLGVAFCDFDRDGDTDVYVANDMVRNFLYRNNGDGTFVDVAYGAGVGFDINGKPQAGMGVDCADVDGNGFPDIFVTNFSEELNTLYANRGDGIFEDRLGEGWPGRRLPAAWLRHEDVRRRQRRRPRHPRHERPRHRQRQAVSAQPHLRAEGSAVRERRRQVPGRDRASRRGAAGAACRPRPRRRRLRQRRPTSTSRSRASAGRRRCLQQRDGEPAATGSASAPRAARATRFGIGATVRVQTGGTTTGARDQQQSPAI